MDRDNTNLLSTAGLRDSLSLIPGNTRYKNRMGTRITPTILVATARPSVIPPSRAWLVLFVWKNRQNMYQLRVKKKTKGASRIALLETQSTMGEVDQRQTAAKPHQGLVISVAKT